jgi:hypothetical protein
MINKVIIILIVVAVLVFVIRLNKETFQLNRDNYIPKKERQLFNILPLIDGRYLGTYLTKDDDKSNNLVMTYSLKSNEWQGPIKNGSPATNTLICDLTYYKDKRLMCVGTKHDTENDIILYDIFIKKTQDIESPWVKIKSNENIMSINFDFHGNMIGCRDDGQLFIKENKNLNSDWIGPINYDIPMKKVLFDKDGKMLGIGLKDLLLYKKNTHDWKESKWDKDHKGFDQLYDVYHDYDGCLVGTSPNGLIKQEHSNYMAIFKDYLNTERKETILTLPKIIFFRTGLEILDDKITNDKDIVDKNLSDELNSFLLLKSKTIQMCKNRKKGIKKDSENILLDRNNQLKKIDEIENLIKILQKK